MGLHLATLLACLVLCNQPRPGTGQLEDLQWLEFGTSLDARGAARQAAGLGFLVQALKAST